MAVTYGLYRYVALDAQGNVVYPSFRTGPTANPLQLNNAIAALSDAALLNEIAMHNLTTVNFVPRPTPSGPTLATDAARMEFATATGQRIMLLVPAVALAHYLPDHETLNPADAQVAALIVKATTSAVGLWTTSGTPATTYIAGSRVRLPQPPIGRYR